MRRTGLLIFPFILCASGILTGTTRARETTMGRGERTMQERVDNVSRQIG
jgi:hypothetical protein